MTQRIHDRFEKLCPECGVSMWVVEVPGVGQLMQCGDCRITLHGAGQYKWKPQFEAPKQVVAAPQPKGNRYMSTKPCPECRKPMWAIKEEGYGIRHQCDECRLTVMFGGAISRWRNLPKNKTPDDMQDRKSG
jgi:hypothetical protein